jgi:hypothetical protein
MVEHAKTSRKSWDDFWPYYVREHAQRSTRILHFIGTTGAIGFVSMAIALRNPAYIVAALVSGYGFAWYSHFAIEKNRPATFTHPAKSLAADFVMWWKMLTGTMDAEVKRAMHSG